MILQRVLFYKLAEMVINTFFDSVSSNFRVDSGYGYAILVKDLSVGDRFSKMIVDYVENDFSIIYHEVTVKTIDVSVYDNKSYYSVELLYLYDERESYSYAQVSEDLREEYATNLEEDEYWSNDTVLIKTSRFKSIYSKIKEFLEYSQVWISDDEGISSIRVFK